MSTGLTVVVYDCIFSCQVLAVDGDTCTVTLEGESREISTPVSGCRLRHEGGHIAFLDTCWAALVRVFGECCRMAHKKTPIVEDDPEHAPEADEA